MAPLSSASAFVVCRCILVSSVSLSLPSLIFPPYIFFSPFSLLKQRSEEAVWVLFNRVFFSLSVSSAILNNCPVSGSSGQFWSLFMFRKIFKISNFCGCFSHLRTRKNAVVYWLYREHLRAVERWSRGKYGSKVHLKKSSFKNKSCSDSGKQKPAWVNFDENMLPLEKRDFKVEKLKQFLQKKALDRFTRFPHGEFCIMTNSHNYYSSYKLLILHETLVHQ